MGRVRLVDSSMRTYDKALQRNLPPPLPSQAYTAYNLITTKILTNNQLCRCPHHLPDSVQRDPPLPPQPSPISHTPPCPSLTPTPQMRTTAAFFPLTCRPRCALPRQPFPSRCASPACAPATGTTPATAPGCACGRAPASPCSPGRGRGGGPRSGGVGVAG